MKKTERKKVSLIARFMKLHVELFPSYLRFKFNLHSSDINIWHRNINIQLIIHSKLLYFLFILSTYIYCIISFLMYLSHVSLVLQDVN